MMCVGDVLFCALIKNIVERVVYKERIGCERAMWVESGFTLVGVVDKR